MTSNIHLAPLEIEQVAVFLQICAQFELQGVEKRLYDYFDQHWGSKSEIKSLQNKEHKGCHSESLSFDLELYCRIKTAKKEMLMKILYLYKNKIHFNSPDENYVKENDIPKTWSNIYQNLKKHLQSTAQNQTKNHVFLELSSMVNGAWQLIGHCLDINALEMSHQVSGVYSFYLDYYNYFPETPYATAIILNHDDLIYVFPDPSNVYEDGFDFIVFPRHVYVAAIERLKAHLLEFKQAQLDWNTLAPEFNGSEQIKWEPYFVIPGLNTDWAPYRL